MKLLVRGTNWLGDTIMSLPALATLRRKMPEAHISLYAPSWAADLLRNDSVVDEAIPIPRGSVLREATALRNQRFDAAILLPNSFRSALVVRIAGIPRRFGYRSDGRGILLSDGFPVPEWKAGRHEIYYYQHLIAAVGGSLGAPESVGEPDQPVLRIVDDQLNDARSLLVASGVDLGRPVVALAAGSTNSNAKRWPAESFADLARSVSEMGSNVVLLGTRGEAAIARKVVEIAGTRPIDLTGSTTVAEAAAILAVADLLISNDTGLAHLGPAVGTRTLVIFGPTDPVTTRPYSDLAEIIREPVECSPCMLRECPIDHRCMTRISSESIFSRVKTLLKE